MKILVTGSTGFVGSHLLKKIAPEHEIFESNRKLFNLESPLFPGVMPKLDYIYHLAAFTGAGLFPLERKADIWERNQRINANLVSYWIRYQPQATFVTLGTSCAYPRDVPLVEHKYGCGKLDPDMLGYASSKVALLQGLICANEQYGMRFKYLIPGTICGPNFSDRDNHFQYDFIRKIHAGLGGERVTFWGDGCQLRQIVDVEDVLNIMLCDGLYNQPVNVSNSRELSLRFYAAIIADELGYSFDKIEWDESKWVGVRSKVLLNSHLPHYEFISEEQSLRRAAHWYAATH